MNKLKFLSFIFATLFLITLVSCDKDDKDSEPSKKALLTAKTWQGNRLLIEGEDITSFVDMDKTFITFNTNGTYLISLDGSKDNGTWELTSSEQKLLMDKGTDFETNVDILKLTSTSLNIKWNEEDPDSGESYAVELRLINE